MGRISRRLFLHESMLAAAAAGAWREESGRGRTRGRSPGFSRGRCRRMTLRSRLFIDGGLGGEMLVQARTSYVGFAIRLRFDVYRRRKYKW